MTDADARHLGLANADGSGPRLVPQAFEPLPLGAIRPTGWLRRQLLTQAEGLTGNLDLFWPDVADSQWIGGQAEGWERGPYWLDGAIGLAYLLDDNELKRRVRRWVDDILARQLDDGWLGPVHDDVYGHPHDPWPVFVVSKALMQYHDAEGDRRVVPAMLRFARRLDRLLDAEHLRSWARYRWADMVLALHWLHDRTAEAWLLDTARKLHDQGFDWWRLYRRFPYRYRSRREECDLRTHVVNNAMAVKAAGVWYRQSGRRSHRDAARRILDTLDAYHGQANGTFSGDEHLAGREPSQGTELCAVVELMFSLEVLTAISGDAMLGDRLELLAFNALPATLSPDCWSHQYDQQVNQVLCCIADDPIYTTNGPDANIFGLAPHYGCCTANLHQGWPKFASHQVMRSRDGGLAITAYAPCVATADRGGRAVTLEVDTEYPFRDSVRVTLRGASTERLPLHLRVPSWCDDAMLMRDDGPPSSLVPGFNVVEVIPAEAPELQLRLPMVPRITVRDRGSVSVYRGPLLYGLRIGEDWRCIGGEAPHQDWEVHPTTPWNYGLIVDPANPSASLRFEERPVGQRPFSPEGAPVIARAEGTRVPGWTLERHAAGPLPRSPLRNTEPAEALTLIPYGCTNLRIAQFPIVDGASTRGKPRTAFPTDPGA